MISPNNQSTANIGGSRTWTALLLCFCAILLIPGCHGAFQGQSVTAYTDSSGRSAEEEVTINSDGKYNHYIICPAGSVLEKDGRWRFANQADQSNMPGSSTTEYIVVEDPYDISQCCSNAAQPSFLSEEIDSEADFRLTPLQKQSIAEGNWIRAGVVGCVLAVSAALTIILRSRRRAV